MEEPDVQAVFRKSGELRDPVGLLEGEGELLRGVVRRLELVDAEERPRRLFPGYELGLSLDVVVPPELGAFPQARGAALPRRYLVLERVVENRRVLADVDLGHDVGVLPGSRARADAERGQEGHRPLAAARKT